MKKQLSKDAAKTLKGLPFPMHIEQAYDSNMRPHKFHLILDDDVEAGKLQRKKGDALCKPFKRFHRLQTITTTGIRAGEICADCMKQAKRLQEYELVEYVEENPQEAPVIPFGKMLIVRLAKLKKEFKTFGFKLDKPTFVQGGERESYHIWVAASGKVVAYGNRSNQADNRGIYHTKWTYYLNEDSFPPAEREKLPSLNLTPDERSRLVGRDSVGTRVTVAGQSGGVWRVRRATKNTITIYDPDAKSPRFQGKQYQYKWDGIGFKRQGEYLLELKKDKKEPGKPPKKPTKPKKPVRKPGKPPKKPAKKPATPPDKPEKPPKKRKKRKPKEKIVGLTATELGKKYGSKLDSLKTKYKTAEDWYMAVVKEYMPRFKSAGVKVPRFDISSGFTSAGTRPTRTLGQAFFKQPQHGMTRAHIFLNPRAVEPLTLINTVIHEVIHTIAGPIDGHGKAFKRIALACGMVGPMRYTTWHPGEGEAFAFEVAKKVGMLPREKFASGFKKQRTRLLKVHCEVCGYIMRITGLWLDTAIPYCPANKEHGKMTVDL